MIQISEEIDKKIIEAIQQYDNSYKLEENPFEELLSMGELIDRLSIVNFKLYKLKDEVLYKKDDDKFKSWASVEDIKLVRERSRLKRCVDQKLLSLMERYLNGDKTAGFNAEVKKYGDQI